MNKEKILQRLKIDEDYYGEFGNQFYPTLMLVDY